VGHMPGLPVAIAGVVSWLSYINIFLLLFNLLPALPLDGGRVLRSALWARRGDFGSATRAAADVSRVLAIFMIVLGVLGSFSSGVGGLWLALLGWFLLSAGTTERRGVSAP
jgi:Zn-dependent protease